MYTPAAFDSLPGLLAASGRVDEATKKTLMGQIRQFFIENEQHERYGVTLLHKHFPIGEDQRLVEYGPQSTAWTFGESFEDTVPKYGSFVKPRSYRLYNNGAVSYEFQFGQQRSDDLNFIERGLALFSQLGVEAIFGIRVLTGDDDDGKHMEVTEGKANIMVDLHYGRSPG